MKKLIIITIIVSLIFSAPFLFAEDLEKILSKNYEIRGGKKKLDALESIKFTGTMTILKKLECPLTLWRKAPDKTRLEAEIMGKSIVQAYNGKVLWWINPKSGTNEPEEMTDADRDEFVETARPICLDSLLDFRRNDHCLEYVGMDEVDGVPVYKLKMTESKDKTVLFYLDAESGIELKIVTRIKSKEGVDEYESNLGSYKSVDGLMFPFSIEFIFKGSDSNRTITCETVFSSIELNKKMKDSLFDMPGSDDSAGSTGEREGK